MAWAGELPLRGPRMAMALAVLGVSVIVACTSPPRDLDMMVWSRANWDPKQEQRDYAECFEHGKRAAYRKYHWRRLAVSRDTQKSVDGLPAAGILARLRAIAVEEKAATAEIAEDCMEKLGYRLVPIQEAGR